MTHKTSRVTSAPMLAAYEGALAPSLFAYPAASNNLSLTQRHLDLMTIHHLAGHMPAVVEDWVKVRKMPTGDQLWLAKDASTFLSALAKVGQTLAQAQPISADDPRLAAVFKRMEPFMRLPIPPAQVQQVLANRPWQWAAFLHKQLAPLSKLMASRAQIEREVSHASKMQEKLNKVKAHFLAMAKKHPDGVVLRLELYAPSPVHLLFGEAAVAQAIATQAHVWSKKLRKGLELQIVHTEMCPQRDEYGGAGMHAMVVVTGQPKAASIRLHEKAGELWKREAGAGSSFVICKGATLQVRYRGRLLNSEGDTLRSELADAAAYFVYGGGPMPLVLKKHTTVARSPKLHFVMGSASPKWEPKW